MFARPQILCLVAAVMVTTTHGWLHPSPSKLSGLKANRICPGRAILGRSTSGIRCQLTSENIDIALYDFQLRLSSTLSHDLSSVSLLSSAVLIIAGALSALSPCSLGLLPVTLSYLSSSSGSAQQNVSSPESSTAKTAFFIAGLVTTFSLLGSGSALVGSVMDSSLQGFRGIKEVFSAVIYIVMGLSLLEIIPINFSGMVRMDKLSRSAGQIGDNAQALALGASSAVVGSSCTTPVLSSILALIASNGNVAVGGLLLLCFGMGYSLPIMVSQFLVKELNLSQWGEKSQWINQFFAAALLLYGGYLSSDVIYSLFE